MSGLLPPPSPLLPPPPPLTTDDGDAAAARGTFVGVAPPPPPPPLTTDDGAAAAARGTFVGVAPPLPPPPSPPLSAGVAPAPPSLPSAAGGEDVGRGEVNRLLADTATTSESPWDRVKGDMLPKPKPRASGARHPQPGKNSSTALSPRSRFAKLRARKTAAAHNRANERRRKLGIAAIPRERTQAAAAASHVSPAHAQEAARLRRAMAARARRPAADADTGEAEKAVYTDAVEKHMAKLRRQELSSRQEREPDGVDANRNSTYSTERTAGRETRRAALLTLPGRATFQRMASAGAQEPEPAALGEARPTAAPVAGGDSKSSSSDNSKDVGTTKPADEVQVLRGGQHVGPSLDDLLLDAERVRPVVYKSNPAARTDGADADAEADADLRAAGMALDASLKPGDVAGKDQGKDQGNTEDDLEEHDLAAFLPGSPLSNDAASSQDWTWQPPQHQSAAPQAPAFLSGPSLVGYNGWEEDLRQHQRDYMESLRDPGVFTPELLRKRRAERAAKDAALKIKRVQARPPSSAELLSFSAAGTVGASNDVTITAIRPDVFAGLCTNLRRRNFRIRELSLARCSLGDAEVRALAGALTHNGELLSLSLAGNDLTAMGAIALARGLRMSKCTELRSVDVSHNPHIGDRGVAALSVVLGAGSSLTHVNFTGVGAGDLGARHLALALSTKRALPGDPAPARLPVFPCILFGENRALTPHGLLYFASAIVANKSIVKCVLDGNAGLGDPAAEILHDLLRCYSSLTELSMARTGLSKEGMAKILAGSQDSDTVRTVHLGGNNLNDMQLISAIAEDFQLSHLELCQEKQVEMVHAAAPGDQKEDEAGVKERGKRTVI